MTPATPTPNRVATIARPCFARVTHLGFLLMLVPALVWLAACGAPAPARDPCANLVGKTRADALQCYATDPSEWTMGGVHRVDGQLYSVMWLNHGYSQTESTWYNWCPDTHWLREFVVLEQGSDDPAVTSTDDPVVFQVTLYCADICHTFGPDERQGYPGTPHGVEPLPHFPLDCSDWPGALEQAEGAVVASPCYESRLCPLGTECFPAPLAAECPPQGTTCVAPDAAAALLDANDNGVPDCDEPEPQLQCAGCTSDDDCPEGSACSHDGECVRSEEVYVDWVNECGRPAPAIVQATLPAGTYRVTALESAASRHPSGNFEYSIPCSNLSVPNLATPPGARYDTAEDAFAHLLATTQVVRFGGGDLLCAFDDDPCSDNQGGVRFQMDLLCPQCLDGVASGDETDVDCGGAVCGACPDGAGCQVDGDCQSGVCDQADGVCMAPACDDEVRNGDETGSDCGGPDCDPCPDGQGCGAASDCQSGVCDADLEQCAAPTCFDGVANGDEEGVDCGGGCIPCDCGAPCDGPEACSDGWCDASGHCNHAVDVYIDWRWECSSFGYESVRAAGLPAGRYRVTALDSAASRHATGWFLYQITCANLSVPEVATPAGVTYDTPEEAFAALTATSSEVQFGGGDLMCGVTDDPCSDNHGGVRFRLEYACAPPVSQ